MPLGGCCRVLRGRAGSPRPRRQEPARQPGAGTVHPPFAPSAPCPQCERIRRCVPTRRQLPAAVNGSGETLSARRWCSSKTQAAKTTSVLPRQRAGGEPEAGLAGTTLQRSEAKLCTPSAGTVPPRAPLWAARRQQGSSHLPRVLGKGWRAAPKGGGGWAGRCGGAGHGAGHCQHHRAAALWG